MTDVSKSNILDVQDIKMHFPIRKALFSKEKQKFVKAVEGVSFSVSAGETFGIVGESGCGKTTVGRCIMGIYKPTSGHILYEGKDMTEMKKSEREKYNREIQLIFQDPYSSLDPRQSVRDILREALKPAGYGTSQSALKDEITALLELVGLNEEVVTKYSHEMSGGQRQRIGIARALACKPKVLICDEPISALDVSVQAQIVNLFVDLQERLGLTYVFIAHDLAVVRHISTRIAVMYLGRIVEITDSGSLYNNPLHPYTQALLSAIPIADYDIERTRTRILLSDEIPDPINAPRGCPFHPRCRYATDKCREISPLLEQVYPDHWVACHLK